MRRVGAGPLVGVASARRLPRVERVGGVVPGRVSVTGPPLARCGLAAGESVEVRGRDPLPAAQVESVAGRQRVEDDAADHQRAMAVDLPRVGLGARPVDDRDRCRDR